MCVVILRMQTNAPTQYLYRNTKACKFVCFVWNNLLVLLLRTKNLCFSCSKAELSVMHNADFSLSVICFYSDWVMSLITLWSVHVMSQWVHCIHIVYTRIYFAISTCTENITSMSSCLTSSIYSSVFCNMFELVCSRVWTNKDMPWHFAKICHISSMWTPVAGNFVKYCMMPVPI